MFKLSESIVLYTARFRHRAFLAFPAWFSLLIYMFSDQLGITTPEYYFYLNQSGCYTVDDVNDQKDFIETMEAMDVIGKWLTIGKFYISIFEKMNSAFNLSKCEIVCFKQLWCIY